MASEVIDELVTRISYVVDDRPAKRAAAATDRLERQSRELDATQRGLNRSLADARRKVADLAAGMSVAEKPTREQRRALAEARAEVTKLAQASQAARGAMSANRAEQRGATADARQAERATRAQATAIERRAQATAREAAALRRASAAGAASGAAAGSALGRSAGAREAAEAAANRRIEAMREDHERRMQRRAIKHAYDLSDLRKRMAEKIEAARSSRAEERRGRLLDAGRGALGAGQAVGRAALGAGAAVAGGVVGLGGAAIASGARREGLRGSLSTAVGSARAGGEFDRLRKFARDTPLELNDLVGAFIKLENRGLKSGERAMKSYGDTAGALNKTLDDVVEAVADAATGEFERLKELGIAAHKQGDKVKLTFRGITETVGADSGAIEDYLIRLGEANFAGGMEGQSKTLEGMWSNLKDAFADLLEEIYDGGLADAVKEVVAEITALAGGAGKLAGGAGKVLGDWVRRLWGYLKELTAGWSDGTSSLQAFWKVASDLIGALMEVGRAVLDVVGHLGGVKTAAVAVGIALTTMLGPLGMVAAAGAALGAGLVWAFQSARDALFGLNDEMDKNREKVLAAERHARDVKIEAMGEHAKKLRRENEETRAANEKKRRMIDAGYTDESIEAATRGAGQKARQKALRGRSVKRLSAEDRAAVRLQVQRAMVGERLSQIAGAEAAGEGAGPATTSFAKTGGGKAKKHKPDSEFEADVIKRAEELAERAGTRAGLKAAAEGKSFREQREIAATAKAERRRDLDAQLARGEALPGEMREGLLKSKGFADAQARQAPPVMVVTARVEVGGVSVQFTGPIGANMREAEEAMDRFFSDQFARKMEDAIAEASSPWG